MQRHHPVPGAVTRWLLAKRRKPQPGRGFRLSDLFFVFVLGGALLVFVFQILPHLLGMV